MIQQILKGIKAYFGALSLISKLKLWNFFLIPIFISIITASVIGLLAYSLSDNIGYYISKVWIWEWGKETFMTVSQIIGGLTILVVGLIFYKHIIMALSAPFMSPVSEKIEAHLSGNKLHNHRNTSFNQQLWRGIRINGRNLLKELLISIPIILIGFIPVIGILSTPLLFVIQAYYAGFGNMDYTLERHFKYKESIDFVKTNRGLAIGNGILFIAFLFIPVLGIILVLPLSVTAASTETVTLLQTKGVLNVSKNTPE